MALRDSVPVRFEKSMQDRLQRISDQTGLKVAQLIRTATEEYVDRIEREGEVVFRLGEEPVKYRSKK